MSTDSHVPGPIQHETTFGSDAGRASGFAMVLGLRGDDELLVNPGLGRTCAIDRWHIGARPAVKLAQGIDLAAPNAQRALLVGDDRVVVWRSPNVVELWDLAKPDVARWSTEVPFARIDELVALQDTVVAAGFGGPVVEIGLATGALRTLDTGARSCEDKLAAHAASRQVAVGVSGGVLLFRGGVPELLTTRVEPIGALGFTASGALVIAGGQTSPLVEVVGPRGERRSLALPAQVEQLASHPVDERVLCCHGRRGLSVLHAADDLRVEAIAGVDASWASFAPRGDGIVYVEQRGGTYVVGTRSTSHDLEPMRLGEIHGCAPVDDRAIVVADIDRVVRCDLHTGAREPLPPSPLSEIWLLAASTGGAIVAGGFQCDRGGLEPHARRATRAPTAASTSQIAVFQRPHTSPVSARHTSAVGTC